MPRTIYPFPICPKALQGKVGCQTWHTTTLLKTYIQLATFGTRLVLVVIWVWLQSNPCLDFAQSSDVTQDVTKCPLKHISLRYFAEPIFIRVGVKEPVPHFDPSELKAIMKVRGPVMICEGAIPGLQ